MSARSRSQTTTGLTFICLCVALMQEAAARAPETETPLLGDVWSVRIEPSYWRDGALIPRPPDSGSGDRNSVNSTGTPEFRFRPGPCDRNSTGTPSFGWCPARPAYSRSSLAMMCSAEGSCVMHGRWCVCHVMGRCGISSLCPCASRQMPQLVFMCPSDRPRFERAYAYAWVQMHSLGLRSPMNR